MTLKSPRDILLMELAKIILEMARGQRNIYTEDLRQALAKFSGKQEAR